MSGEELPLHRRHCVACRPGMPVLGEEQAAALHTQLDPSWERDGTRSLRRELRFRDFREPFALATRVALLAEAEDHHPDMEIRWGVLVLTLSTHVAGGLTGNDFVLAARIDRFAPG